ncbi:MAG: tRNA pseudouridine synthase A [Desulfurococcales archaeon]|nr:tRNA pseudouridine synthase A [Desulfurococcales archaeon]
MQEPGLQFIESVRNFCERRPEWIKIKDEETDYSYGKIPVKRSLDEHIRLGVINLDKPPGPTSHEVVAWIKRMFNLKRAGHGGTLERR